jgi:hypothetical protein
VPYTSSPEVLKWILKLIGLEEFASLRYLCALPMSLKVYLHVRFQGAFSH